MLFGHEGAVEGLFQLADLAAHGAAGELGQRLGVALPGGDGLQHGPAGDAVDAEITLDSFRCASSSFSARAFSASAGLGQVPPVPGMGAQPADLLRGHEAARQRAPLGDLGQPEPSPACHGRPGQRLPDHVPQHVRARRCQRLLESSPPGRAQCHLRPLCSPSLLRNHLEGSRGGRLASRRHAVLRYLSLTSTGYPYTTSVDVNYGRRCVPGSGTRTLMYHRGHFAVLVSKAW